MLVTLLDVGLKPTVIINPEYILRVQYPSEKGEATIVSLHGGVALRVANTVEDVKEIANSGKDPEYAINEDGQAWGYPTVFDDSPRLPNGQPSPAGLKAEASAAEISGKDEGKDDGKATEAKEKAAGLGAAKAAKK